MISKCRQPIKLIIDPNLQMKNIMWFKNTTLQDLPIVGAKNAFISEAYRHLTPKGINIPNGFSITSHTFHQHFNENKLTEQILSLHRNLDYTNMEDLEHRSLQMQDMILQSKFNSELEEMILKNYHELRLESSSNNIAIKSSSADYSLPGTSILNIGSDKDLLDGIIKCLSSFFNPREITYRASQGINLNYGISIGIQKMINTSNTCCGEAYSRDIYTNFDHSMIVNGTYGIKLDLIEKGLIKPDEWTVFEKKLNPSFVPIIKKELGLKTHAYIGGYPLELKKLDKQKMNSFCLNDEDVLKIAKDTKIIERFFSSILKKELLIEIEWALDDKNRVNIVRIAHSRNLKPYDDVACVKVYELNNCSKTELKILAHGQKIGSEIICGQICKMKSSKDPNFRENSIVLSDDFDRSWNDIFNKSKAIISNTGNKSSLVARMCRDLNLNAVIGTKDATEKINDGQLVTLDNSTISDSGIIWDTQIPFHFNEINCRKSLPKMNTKLMMELSDFSKSFHVHRVPNDGAASLTLDSIYKSLNIDIPLLTFLAQPNFNNQKTKDVLHNSKGFKSIEHYIFEKVSHSIAYASTPFFPKSVIVKLSKFHNDAILKFETEVLKKVKDIIGFSNICIELPHLNDIKECCELLKKLEEFGIHRQHGWKVYFDVSTFSNLLIIEEYLKEVDGCMIHLDLLTDVPLDSENLSEIDLQIKNSIQSIISKKTKKFIGVHFKNILDNMIFMNKLVEIDINALVIPSSEMVNAANSIENYIHK